MEQELEGYLDFAKDIAKYAGEIMLKYFKQKIFREEIIIDCKEK
jgi:hypothetical protein